VGNTYNPDYYRKNAQKISLRQKEKRLVMRGIIRGYKAERGCSLCGVDIPEVLDLHHRADKEFTIGEAWVATMSEKRLRSELAKCDVLCCNCHRLVHAGIVKYP